ncbi:MAG: hypothetical protein BGP03_23520 [Pseudonocardia sp. 73-21]|nr:MAG: hypothetical protein BGP03_23520 [Pseudonocardia sp. 73-21]
MLGSGLRVDEICAVRGMDVDLDGIPVVDQNDMRLVPVVAVRPASGAGQPGRRPRAHADRHPRHPLPDRARPDRNGIPTDQLTRSGDIGP